MKSFVAPLSVFLSLLLIFNISCPVFASSSSSMEYNEMYAYYFCEVYCGADFSEYQNTDEGMSLYDYANEHGTRSVDDAINYYCNQMQEQIGDVAADVRENTVNAVNQTADFARDNLKNTVTTTANVNNYIGERVRRTVVDTGRKFFDVSGSDWFNSIYNDLFNNDGYKQQYEQSQGTGEYSGEAFGHSYTIKVADTPTQLERTGTQSNFILGFYSGVYSVSYWTFLVTLNVDGESYYSTAFGVTDQYKCRTNNVYVNGNTINIDVDYGYLDYYNNHAVLQYTFASGSPGNGDLTESGGAMIPTPKSCGVINYNGDWVDVAVDPDDRYPPGTINPNGTFTDENGNDYPIYIEEPGDGGGENPDPGQLTDPGVWQIIKTVGDNPFSNNYNDPNANYSGDNNGNGNSNNPFGLSIKDFFDNIGKGIGNVFRTLFGGIIKLLESILNAIKTLFLGDYVNSFGNFQIDFDFNIVNDILDAFFGALGATTGV